MDIKTEKMECDVIEHISKLFKKGLPSIEAMEMIADFISYLKYDNEEWIREKYNYIMSLKINDIDKINVVK